MNDQQRKGIEDIDRVVEEGISDDERALLEAMGEAASLEEGKTNAERLEQTFGEISDELLIALGQALAEQMEEEWTEKFNRDPRALFLPVITIYRQGFLAGRLRELGA